MHFSKEVSIFKRDAIAKEIKAIETDFKVVRGKISSIISESELVTLENGKKTMYSRLSSAEQTIDGMTRQYSEMKQDINGITIKQTSIVENIDGIKTTVSKKVGEDEIISKINQSAEAITIDANKIKLNAEDIRMKATTLTWSSKHSSLDAAGKIIVNNIEASGGIVAGWDIKNAGIYKTTDNKTVSVRPGTNENGDFLVVQDGSNYPFWVRSDGSMHAERGSVGGWDISDSYLKTEAQGVFRTRILKPNWGNDAVFLTEVKQGGSYVTNFKISADGSLYLDGVFRFGQYGQLQLKNTNNCIIQLQGGSYSLIRVMELILDKMQLRLDTFL